MPKPPMNDGIKRSKVSRVRLKAAPGDQDPASGQFLPGNKAAVGRRSATPMARKQYEIRTSIYKELEKSFPDILERMSEQARDGDVRAARLLLEFSLGKPRAGRVQEPTELDINDAMMTKLEDAARDEFGVDHGKVAALISFITVAEIELPTAMAKLSLTQDTIADWYLAGKRICDDATEGEAFDPADAPLYGLYLVLEACEDFDPPEDA